MAETKEEITIPKEVFAYQHFYGDVTEDYDEDRLHVHASTEMPRPRKPHKVGVYKLVRVIEVVAEAMVISSEEVSSAEGTSKEAGSTGETSR